MLLKEFNISVHLDGHHTIEDPRCPSYWKGSGCYDIDIPSWCDMDIEVWAETEDQAKQFVRDYEFVDPGSIVEVDAIQIESVKFIKDLPDRDPEEQGVIEPSSYDYDWHEYYTR